jgi:cytochrome c-type biogenesis protein CcmH
VFEMVARLEKRLADQPDDVAGWARLGRSYMVMQQADKARAAYARAHALEPDNVEILSDYAWVVFNADPTATTGLVNELYTRLGRLAPNHPDALWFQGFAALQQGNYRQTLKYWERLQTLLPPGDPGREQLQQAIAGVRAKLSR